MQSFLFTLALVCSLSFSWAIPPRASPALSAPPPPPPPPPTLTQDIEELYRLIPTIPLNKLALRYLLNDAEFQGVIRILNSHDAFTLRMRLSAQPEVIQFQSWLRSELLLSGGGVLELEESEEMLKLFNPTPYWAVYGWQGFFNEFLAYFPQELIRAQVNAKIIQGGSLAQLFTKLKALQPVYERALAFPESKRIIAQLEQNGVDVSQMDQFIRTMFGWHNLTLVDTTASSVAVASTSVVPPTAQSVVV